MSTPNSERLQTAIREIFEPAVGSVSIRGRNGPCRKIRRSDRWSQHAWGNALDLHGDGDTLGVLANWLEAHAAEFSIRNVCYFDRGPCNRADHRNHIHVDFNPRGIGTPPCAGGTLQVEHADGSVSGSWTLTGTQPPDDDGGGGFSFGPSIPGLPGLGELSGLIPGADTVIDVATAPGKLAAALLDPDTWVRILQVVGGAVLAIVALILLGRELGVDRLIPSPVTVGG